MSIAELARRLWFFLRRDRVTAELEEEMRLHMELRAERERAAGFDEQEAQRRAVRRFGNRGRHVEESRDQWGMRWADELSLDLRYALRSLRRAPALSAIVVLTLALGIGATTAIFSVMDAAIFRPLPMHEPERLVVMDNLDVPLEGLPRRRDAIDLPRLSEETAVFGALGAYAAGGLNLTGGRAPMRVQAGLITPGGLRLLGVDPVRGRLFTEDEGRVDGPDVAVISHALWRSQFGGAEDVVGQQLSLNDRPFEIVGVMPRRFAFPDGSDVWIPMTVPMSMARTEVFRMMILTKGIGRLAPGVDAARANAHFVSMLEERGYRPEPGEPPPEIMVPLRRHFAGDGNARLWMVLGLAALLLAAACVNVCGLLLARWTARRRELAVRSAIGAGRGRLVRQLLTESAVLALTGMAAGLLVAHAGLPVVASLTPPELLALTPPRIDGRVLAIALAMSVATAIGIGVLPGLVMSGGDLAQSLRAAGTGATRRGGRRLGGGLVMIEVGLAVVLLVGSGLLVKSLVRLHDVETGVRPEQVVTGRVALSNALHPDHASRRTFFERVREELARTPGITTVGIVSELPMRGELNPRLMVDIEGRPEIEKSPSAEHIIVSPEYFDALGIGIVAGRTFLSGDSLASRGEAIINRSLARRYWPEGNAIGARITQGRELRIVGVVNDVRTTSLDGEQHDVLYLPFASGTPRQATFVVRGTLSTDAMIARMRDAVRRVDESQVVYDLKTMEQVVSESVAEQRASSALATAFAVVTFLLAAMGLYGLLAFTVVQRTRELGIRVALGARRGHVVWGVVEDGLRLAGAGILVGLVGAYGATRLLRAQLYEVAPTDPAVFLAAPVLLLLMALVAAAAPAIRASRVDPMRALRAE